MSRVPKGWRGLGCFPLEGGEVDGLLSNGKVADAEWWGPVPEALWGPDGNDGSGWVWNASGLADFGAGLELVAWRPRSSPPISLGLAVVEDDRALEAINPTSVEGG